MVKTEPPESEIVDTGTDDILESFDEEIIQDIKDMDIVSHILCEDAIKSEIVPKDILESKHSESTFLKIENKTQSEILIKTEEDTIDEHVSNDIGQGVVEVQGKLLLPDTKNKYFYCSHCSFKSKQKENLERHILGHYKNEEIKFHCYICNFMTPKVELMIEHTKMHSEVQLKTCTKKHKKRYCCKKCAFVSGTCAEFKIHEQSHKRKAKMNDRHKYHCVKCNYKTSRLSHFNSHKLIHLSPEESQYFYCYHCSYKSNRKYTLRRHILTHFKNEDIKFHCYSCNFMTLKRNLIIKHIKKHSKIQFKNLTKKHKKRYCCEKCVFVSGTYAEFKIHQQSHKRKAEMNDQNKYHCVKCNYKTSSMSHFNTHKLIHLTPEECQYFCCYHCSYKSNRKYILRRHVLMHFKNEDIKFHCYICNFMTLRRKSIIEHIKKHSQIRN